ncbi:MAG TPA: thermonuclease family protein, partial [Methanoregulaceae archaeon]|nr:thermonuclease family protein [Methanoregulaceae archaeon]
MNTSRSAFLLLVLAACCLIAGCSTDTGFPGGSPLPAGQSETATVTRTIDGDTVYLSFPDGRAETLRILGIDTPEMTPEGNDPGKFRGITDPEFLSIWGEEAASYTNEKLTGKIVTISYDPAAGSRDTYGRLLATVILPDGTNHGEDLIRQGLA